MIPVDQTTFGTDLGHPSPDIGNCFAATVASIFELTIEEVPNFAAHDDWWGEVKKWLKARGYYPFHATLKPETRDDWLKSMLGYHAIGGDSDTIGTPHSVVGKDGKIVHDPHPLRPGLVIIDSLTLFIPLDPSKMELKP